MLYHIKRQEGSTCAPAFVCNGELRTKKVAGKFQVRRQVSYDKLQL